MALLIAPGICRFAVNGSYAGRPVVNIFDMKIDTTGAMEGRGDAIERQAGNLLNNFQHHILDHFICNDYTANNVSWVDLDSAEGTVGTRSSTDEETWPQSGTLDLAPMPGNVAMRVNKRTTSTRGSRQGRTYLCGIGEASTASGTPNLLVTGEIGAYNGWLEDFRVGIEMEGNPVQNNDAHSEFHVVHTVGGVFSSSSHVTAFEVDPMVASQRRRLRG